MKRADYGGVESSRRREEADSFEAPWRSPPTSGIETGGDAFHRVPKCPSFGRLGRRKMYGEAVEPVPTELDSDARWQAMLMGTHVGSYGSLAAAGAQPGGEHNPSVGPVEPSVSAHSRRVGPNAVGAMRL